MPVRVPVASVTEPVQARAVSGHPPEREIEIVGRQPDAPRLAPVIRSKVQPPPLRSSTLSRQRLLDRLEAATSSRVTLLVAEAGYGKTTLLGDFSLHSGRRSIWYKADPTDGDWVTLVNYLLAAAREVVPGFGSSTESLLGQMATESLPKEAVVASLMGELQQLSDAPTIFILDDFHSIDESADACELTTRLIRDAPASFRFILSSRRRPALTLARLAAMDELAEIGTDELRFSREETDKLFAEGYGQPLETDVLNEVDARTEGWAASLQLFHSSTHGRPSSAVRSLARSLSGATGTLYDFLAEEVLSHLPEELRAFVLRSALLERIVPGHVTALFGDRPESPSLASVRDWIEEVDRLGILSRSSRSSETRQFHPLLRDFLLRELRQRFKSAQIRAMHARVARMAEATDALTACHHYIEAGQQTTAMSCLGASVLVTMGSGQAGVAADLISRLAGVPADPAVVAIQARRLLEDGDTAGAAMLLAGTDVSGAPPAVRAVFRQTKLSLGWRSGDRESLFSTLREIQEDTETPPILREIAQIFVDSSPLSPSPASLPSLGRRLQEMADTQARAGHDYYAAISVHNSSVALLNAGQYERAIEAAYRALSIFDQLSFDARERYSTHSVIAACLYELGRAAQAEPEIEAGLSSGHEEGDVHAVFAYLQAVVGNRERSLRFLASADTLQRQGRSDLQGDNIAAFARALLQMPSDPAAALRTLEAPSKVSPLDLGFDLQHRSLIALTHAMAGDPSRALELCQAAAARAVERGARRILVRLVVIDALARGDGSALRVALAEAVDQGGMALLETADLLGRSLHLISPVPPDIKGSIAQCPGRWLPVLRRQLEAGDSANARAAAALLDDHGELEDVGRLRAFAKAYRRRGRVFPGLGKSLARRVSAPLEVHDLGRVRLAIGQRSVALSQMRRKPASLLMYLVSRPSFTAPREQILDELWPESDPTGAANSLNQSLHFLRREIDPWYEGDVSAEYVVFESDLLWLDPSLVRVTSSEFISETRRWTGGQSLGADAVRVMRLYQGQFAPEFEYEEWAMAWRSRLHATYLDFAASSISATIDAGDLPGARDVAVLALENDLRAAELEHALIWIYLKLGARSAALAQYEHLAAQGRLDGLEPPSLAEMAMWTRPPVARSH